MSDDYNDHYPLDILGPVGRQKSVSTALAVTNRVRQRVLNWLQGLEDDDEFPEIDLDDMTGACAIVSWIAQRVLTNLGYQVHLVRGEFDEQVHCWVQIGHVIIDGTATQFGIPGPVYLTTRGKDPRYVELFRDDDAEEEFLRDWRSQSPYRFGREVTTIADEVVKLYRRRKKA
jgi:hypothetical protein